MGRLPAQDVQGVVVRADSTPVTAVVVELHRITEISGSVVDSTLSDDEGRFRFELGRDSDSVAVFLPAARHDGVRYWGTPVHGRRVPGETQPQLLTVFDTAAVVAPLTDQLVRLRHVVLTPFASGLQVDEIIDLAGRENRTLTAADDTSFLWLSPLADEAHGVLAAEGGVAPAELDLVDGVAAFKGALPPSGVRIAVSYFVPASLYNLEVRHPTRRLDVLLVDAMELAVEATGLSEVPVGAEGGTGVRRFTASDLTPGISVSVRVGAGGRGRGAPWLWLAAALVLAGGAAASSRLARRAGP